MKSSNLFDSKPMPNHTSLRLVLVIRPPTFFSSQSRLYLGTEELQPTRSALNKDRHGRDHLGNYQDSDVEHDDDIKDDNAKELPNKVDQFVEYINAAYFDGQLDTGSKDILKKGGELGGDTGGNSSSSRRKAKKIFNGDDARGTSPLSRRAAAASAEY